MGERGLGKAWKQFRVVMGIRIKILVGEASEDYLFDHTSTQGEDRHWWGEELPQRR